MWQVLGQGIPRYPGAQAQRGSPGLKSPPCPACFSPKSTGLGLWLVCFKKSCAARILVSLEMEMLIVLTSGVAVRMQPGSTCLTHRGEFCDSIWVCEGVGVDNLYLI